MSNYSSWRGAKEVRKMAQNVHRCFLRAGIEVEPRVEKNGDLVIFEVSQEELSRVKRAWPICQVLPYTGDTVLEKGLDMRQGIRFEIVLKVIQKNPTAEIRIEAVRIKP